MMNCWLYYNFFLVAPMLVLSALSSLVYPIVCTIYFYREMGAMQVTLCCVYWLCLLVIIALSNHVRLFVSIAVHVQNFDLRFTVTSEDLTRMSTMYKSYRVDPPIKILKDIILFPTDLASLIASYFPPDEIDVANDIADRHARASGLTFDFGVLKRRRPTPADLEKIRIKLKAEESAQASVAETASSSSSS